MKKLLFRTIIIGFFATMTETGVAQTWAWAKSGIGSGDSYGTICTDAIGNVFITGVFDSPSINFGVYTLTNTSLISVYLVKYDANGNVLWAKSPVGSSSGNGDDGCSVSADPMGNVYVTGYFSSPTIVFGSYTLTNYGTESIFLAKYDANGNVLWAKNSISSFADYGLSVSTDANGNAYIAGTFHSSTISFGSYTLTNAGSQNVFLVKYDVNGNVLWANSSVGFIGNGSSVSTDAIGNTYLTGNFQGSPITFGSYTLTNTGGLDVFLTKYDTNGNVLWAKNSVAASGNSFGNSVSSDAEGNAYITGCYSSPTINFGSYTLTNSGTQNSFLTKYDTYGNVLWAKNVNGSNIQSQSVSNNSNCVYICGGFSGVVSIDTYTLTDTTSSQEPMFIARFDLNGNATYATWLTSGGDDWSGILVDKSCNVYLTGDFLANPYFYCWNKYISFFR
jgi:hypothetical protein